MELNGFNSDDYIYLQFNNDFEDHNYINYKKGQITRFSVEGLRNLLLDKKYYGDIIELIPKENITKYDLLPYQVYEGVLVKEAGKINQVNIRSNDLIIIDEEFKRRFHSSRIGETCFGSFSYNTANTEELNKITKKETIYDSKNKFLSKESEALTCLGLQCLDSSRNLDNLLKQNNIEKIYKTNYTFDLYIDTKAGDFLSFKYPSIALLFMDNKWTKFIANTHFLTPEEELIQFKKDFENRILCGRTYYKLNDNIKIKNINDFQKKEIFPKNFDYEMFFDNRITFFGWNELDNYDLDNDGYVKYVWINDSEELEEEILKIARVCNLDEANDHYEHFKQREKLENAAFHYYCNHKRVYKRMKKENLTLTYIEFMKLNEDKLAKQKFYKNRKNNNNLKFIDGEDEIKYQATRLVKVLKQIKPSSNK